MKFVPEEDSVDSYAKHHSEDTVRHHAEILLPPPLLLFGHHLRSLTNLLPVTDVFVGVRTDGKGVKD